MATIVMRSKVKEKITGSCFFEWCRIDGRRDRFGYLHLTYRRLSREKADELIDKLGLKESHRAKEGDIYDTPEGAFKALFPDGVRDRLDSMEIDKLDKYL
jgi:hypothetical protein